MFSLLSLTAGYELFPYWIGYFAFGLWLGRRFTRGVPDDPVVGLGATCAAVAAAAVLLTFATAGSPRPGFGGGTGSYLLPLLPLVVIATCTAALWGGPWLMRRSQTLARLVAVISTYSLGIYIIHPMLMRGPAQLMFSLLVDNHLPYTIIPTVVLIPVTLVLTLGVLRLLARTPLAMTLGIARDHRRPQPSSPTV